MIMGRTDSKRLPRLVSNPLFLVLSAVLIAVLTAVLSKPPTALDEFTPADEFSAIRAMVTLEELLVESEPHVNGSPLNLLVRERIEARFEDLGYQPEIQSLFHCHPHFGSCANVENIIAVKAGSEGRDAVLVTAHYDSSWAGPGAGDDGAGTASIIEMARMANEFGQFRNDVIFLITDAEEQGLVGAHAFAEDHPLFSKVKAVINLEARGVTGPSMMFETGDGNRSIIRILSKSLDRPVANSVSYEVYKRMPNDTDYSVYRNRGVMGVNFAFNQGVALYHSKLDDVSHLDSNSVQHQGDNASAMLFALADRDIAKIQSREDAAYIDVFGRVLWHYPISIATGVTVVLTVLILLGIILTYKKKITPVGVILALIAQVVAIIVLVGGAWLLNWPLGEMVETNPIEHPFPGVAQFCVFIVCIVAVWFAGKLLAHRVSYGDAMLVSWAGFAALALALDFNLPAGSFLALLPMAAFFTGMLLDTVRYRSRNGLLFASVFGFWTASYIAAYFFFMLGTIISFNYTHLMVIPLVLPVLLAIPLWFSAVSDPIPGWKPGFFLAGLVIAAAIYHQFLPGFSQDRPRGMNLVYQQRASVDQSYLVLESPRNAVDQSYAEIAGFGLSDLPGTYSSNAFPLNKDQPTVSRFATTTPSLGLAEAAVTELSIGDEVESTGSARIVNFLVSAPPDSERLVIAFPTSSEINKAYVNGVLAIDGNAETKRRVTSTFIAMPYPGPEEISVEVQFEGRLPEGFNVLARMAFPESLWEEYRYTWPENTEPIFHGFRAEVVSGFRLSQD